MCRPAFVATQWIELDLGEPQRLRLLGNRAAPTLHLVDDGLGDNAGGVKWRLKIRSGVCLSQIPGTSDPGESCLQLPCPLSADKDSNSTADRGSAPVSHSVVGVSSLLPRPDGPSSLPSSARSLDLAGSALVQSPGCTTAYRYPSPDPPTTGYRLHGVEGHYVLGGRCAVERGNEGDRRAGRVHHHRDTVPFRIVTDPSSSPEYRRPWPRLDGPCRQPVR